MRDLEQTLIQIGRELDWPETPDLAAAGLPDLGDTFLRSGGLARADVDHWIVHPGGPRIRDRVQCEAYPAPT